MRALGHSLTVELRTLTPSVLVRIQLPQPRIKMPLRHFYFWSVAQWFDHATNVALVRQ